MAKSALVSSFVSIDFSVFQGTPHSSLLCNRPLFILIKTEHEVVSGQALLFPSHSILGVASEFSRAVWTIQRGSGYQSPQGEQQLLPVKFMVHGVHQW